MRLEKEKEGVGGWVDGLEEVVGRMVGVAQALRPFKLGESWVWATVGRVKRWVVGLG